MEWSVAGTLRKWAAQRPDEAMLTLCDATGAVGSWTWREIDERSSRIAHALAAGGVGAGDRVAFLDKSGPAYFEVLFAGAKLNAVNVAVNWRLAPPEIAQVLNDSDAKILIVGEELLDAVTAVEDQLTKLTRIVVVEGGQAKFTGLDEWIADQPRSDPGVVARPDDVAVQFYTSGTTGLPKGVMLTNANLGSGIPGLGAELGLEADAVNLAAMPLFHIGGSGWALVGIHAGARTVLMREVDPAVVIRAVEEQRVTHAFLVPAVLQFMLVVPGAAERDYASLESILYGAAPISEDVLERCLSTFGCDMVQVYGMTETTGAITVLRAAEHVSGSPRLRSCGIPIGGIEIRIVDPSTGADCAPEAVGELWTRSAQNMAGYYGKPDDTARTITDGGWLHTGDAGFFDADGFIYLHDRVKDMIVSGGENVYPAEVENVLMSHPAVADVGVIGVPDTRWGETVKAIVVPAGDRPDPEDVIAFCRERLAHFKCPTSIDFVDALPRNPSGKILKRELRAPYWAGVDRNIG